MPRPYRPSCQQQKPGRGGMSCPQTRRQLQDKHSARIPPGVLQLVGSVVLSHGYRDSSSIAGAPFRLVGTQHQHK